MKDQFNQEYTARPSRNRTQNTVTNQIGQDEQDEQDKRHPVYQFNHPLN